MIGTVLKHRYEVIEKIGEGNLFSVYKCEDKIDNRMVAIKVLLPQYASNRLFAERLLVEAQAMIGVAHPGIVEVYDCGEQDGYYFTVVEYVRGVDLRERIRRSAPFTLSTVADVGLAICDVLDFAHRKGFVHGDLRPGNILVTPEGQIKISNFWVNGAMASAPSISANAIMRSIHYMSPEVAEGKAPTPASDIYSVGTILFEVLVGTVPFDGDTPIAIALQHAKAPVPSIRTLNPGVPKNLEAALQKALQKAPDNRFRSAKAMLNELKSVKESLNLTKPLVWSEVKGKEEPLPEPEFVANDEAKKDIEPPMLNALRKTLITLVVVFGLVAAVLIGFVWFRPGEVKVPDMLGKTRAEAEAIAQANNIKLAPQSEQFSDTYPAGTIYYMNPSAGRTVKSGAAVDIWVSKGSEFGTVPDVTRMSTDMAKEKIGAAGLSVGEISEDFSNSVPTGDVVRQTPSAGTKLSRNQPVNLVFSLGPASRDTSSAIDETSSQPQEPKSYDVAFTVPQGPETQAVKIIVIDDNGENTAYAEALHPGDEVNETVQGTGKTTIRILIDDKLVREVRK